MAHRPRLEVHRIRPDCELPDVVRVRLPGRLGCRARHQVAIEEAQRLAPGGAQRDLLDRLAHVHNCVARRLDPALPTYTAAPKTAAGLLDVDRVADVDPV